MKRIAERLFGLREGERGLALLMAFYHLLLLTTLYFLKPVRDSLFLTTQGAAELPFVFMLTTVAVIPVAVLHTRAGRSLPLGRLVNGVSLVLVANLVVLRWLVTLEASWVYYLLYVWVSIYAVLVTSQFWLLANAVFNASESKRTFALLSAGGILGAVVGGELTGLLVQEWEVPTNDLILIGAGVLAATVLLVNYIRYRSRRRDRETETEETEDAFTTQHVLTGIWGTLRGSRHLLLVIGLIALAVVATTFIDFQFKTVAAREFSEGALTAFFGRFYARVSLAALILQLVVAPRLIRILGVGGALALLPLGLVGGTAAFFIAPSIITATALRGIDQSLKHSVDRTGRELLFVPVGLATKKRVKIFIDLFFDQGMQGVGGFLLVLFTFIVGLSVRQLSFAVFVLLGAWLLLVVLARSSYINQFRDMLRRRVEAEEDEEEDRERASAMSFGEIVRSLRSRSRGPVLDALDRLEEGEAEVPENALRNLLRHNSAEVRRRTLRVMRKRSVPGQNEAVAEHMEDADPDVRLEAARYLYRHLHGDGRRLLRQGLEHPDVRIRSVVVGLIAKDGGPEERALLEGSLLRELVAYEGEHPEEGRLQVARACAVLARPEREDLLRILMEDPVPRVARRAIKSAGQTGERAFVAPLLEHLTMEEHEEEAHRSLAAFGERILGTLYDYLTDPEIEERIRRRVPPILARSESQAAVDVLLLSGRRVSVPVWHEVVRALSKLRQAETLRFGEAAVEQAVEREARRYCALGQILHLRRTTEALTAEAVTVDLLEQARTQSLERIFRLLGLRHDQEDLYNAYLGLTGSKPPLQASAVEFVDNLIEWDTKRLVLPLLDDGDGTAACRQGPDLFDLEIEQWSEALIYLLADGDPRLAVPALESAVQMKEHEVQAAVAAACEQAAPEVRRAARRLFNGEQAAPETAAE